MSFGRFFTISPVRNMTVETTTRSAPFGESSRHGTIFNSMRRCSRYTRRMKSIESNSPSLVTTLGFPFNAFSTARRPWPALVFGTMQSERGAPTSCAVRARKRWRAFSQASQAPSMSRYQASSASRTSSAARSGGRPSEWLAR
jgi:hypothetical protein